MKTKVNIGKIIETTLLNSQLSHTNLDYVGWQKYNSLDSNFYDYHICETLMSIWIQSVEESNKHQASFLLLKQCNHTLSTYPYPWCLDSSRRKSGG